MRQDGDTTIRPATPDDIATVDAIAARSVRTFHRGFYDDATIEDTVRIYGVDWQTVRDGTYFVAEIGNTIAGAGGWSFRKTIGGAHGPGEPASPRLDPAHDPAHIRAFYVDPAHARRGLAAALLARSEDAARAAGFTTAELTATLQSETAWAALGYRTVDDYWMPVPGRPPLHQKLMRKSLVTPGS